MLLVIAYIAVIFRMFVLLLFRILDVNYLLYIVFNPFKVEV
mgnify:CR=1 FL=1|jgi:hypothetical protein